MKKYISLVLFLILVVGGGSLIGAMNVPGEWYVTLNKPWFNPPSWVFAPVWTTLYVLIAIAGWRVWQREDMRDAMWAWWAQLGLNFLWSPVFFSLQSPGSALIVILALLAAIVTFMRLVWNRDRVSGLLFVPYLAWVSFATILTMAIFVLN